jgi:hypothetical protein
MRYLRPNLVCGSDQGLGQWRSVEDGRLSLEPGKLGRFAKLTDMDQTCIPWRLACTRLAASPSQGRGHGLGPHFYMLITCAEVSLGGGNYKNT